MHIIQIASICQVKQNRIVIQIKQRYLELGQKGAVIYNELGSELRDKHQETRLCAFLQRGRTAIC